MTSAEYYLSVPARGSGKPVIVIHAWWGLTQCIKRLCDRLAKNGYIALAPDLYAGRVADTIHAAKQLRKQAMAQRKEPAYRFLIRQINTLKAHEAATGSRIGVIGCSMGGHWACWLAQRPELEIVATVVFYAARCGNYENCISSFQFHFAEHDEFVSKPARENLARCFARYGVAWDGYDYPGTRHWFFESTPDIAYSRFAAELAWNRTVTFLNKHM